MIGIPISWCLIGEWAALATAVVMCVIGIILHHRSDPSGATVEHGCAVFAFVILVGLLIPGIGKIRQAADRIKAEREAERQGQSKPAGGE
jgi:hypothetical protein